MRHTLAVGLVLVLLVGGRMSRPVARAVRETVVVERTVLVSETVVVAQSVVSVATTIVSVGRT